VRILAFSEECPRENTAIAASSPLDRIVKVILPFWIDVIAWTVSPLKGHPVDNKALAVWTIKVSCEIGEVRHIVPPLLPLTMGSQ
jgi:hypothetical protein